MAYVYDPQGIFHRSLNTEMVDLEVFLSEEDTEFIREFLGHHAQETGSAIAEQVLQRWHQNSRHFKKVMPKDYRRVLEAIGSAEEQGRNVEEAIMAASIR